MELLKLYTNIALTRYDRLCNMMNAREGVFGMIAAGRRSWKGGERINGIGIDQENGYKTERQSGYKTDTRREANPGPVGSTGKSCENGPKRADIAVIN